MSHTNTSVCIHVDLRYIYEIPGNKNKIAMPRSYPVPLAYLHRTNSPDSPDLTNLINAGICLANVIAIYNTRGTTITEHFSCNEP